MEKKKQKMLIIIVFLIIIIALILLRNYIDNSNNLYEKLNVNQDDLNIFYLNVGQGDSTFITINGYNMLIDSGNDQDGYYIVQFLKSQNINKIDYFILTHFDEDHIGGAYKILEEIEIGTLYMPANSNNTKTYDKLISTIKECNINTNTSLKATKDVNYSLGNANWKVLNINNGNDLNDSSIVIELEYKDTKYLFMGDATTKVEEQIDWDEVDILKVAHHGSKSSTSQQFLEKIKPKYAVISVGNDNGYDFPSNDVIGRLEHNNIKIYRTDKNGTIWVTSNGITINVKCIEYNFDGTGRKQAIFFKREYLFAFFFYYANVVIENV